MRIDKLVPKPEEDFDSSIPWVAIVGNPNCGKTALFNRLTGLHHKVGNYPGITVEKKSGRLKGHKILLHDFPGTYSLNAKSIDEKIVADMVQSWRHPANRPRAVIVVVDATNLTRNIYLALQILDWNVPTIIVLNMIDEARRQGLKIDHELLKIRLNAAAVIPASAKYGEGISEIIDAVLSVSRQLPLPQEKPRLLEIDRFLEPMDELVEFLALRKNLLNHHPLIETLRLLSETDYADNLSSLLSDDEQIQLSHLLETVKLKFRAKDIPYQALEQSSRFAFIDVYLSKAVSSNKHEIKTYSERLDTVLTHRIFGPIVMLLVLGFIFHAIFSWTQYPMELLQNGVDWLAHRLDSLLSGGPLKSLLIDGIINGVGSILVFFPQIILLVFFLSILEDSGYMARMAFMMDRLLGKIGLQGRSILPLLSGFACAIPAVTAARTIDNWRDRLITILVIPLMSCSARLPVYTLLISAFVPESKIVGFLSTQAAVLMGIYLLGIITAIVVALIFKRIFRAKHASLMMMELPPYRRPLLPSLWWQVYDRGKSFLLTAGSIILAVSIVLWFLAFYPRPSGEQPLSPRQQIEQSYAGKIGHALEPIIKPLGFDWKIGIGLVTSFAAREVIISTLSTIYNLEDISEQKLNLIDSLRLDRDAAGNPSYTILTAISLMVFFAYAAQCMATFAIVKNETNSWRWPLLMVIYLTIMAYIGSFAVYQGGKFLGF